MGYGAPDTEAARQALVASIGDAIRSTMKSHGEASVISLLPTVLASLSGAWVNTLAQCGFLDDMRREKTMSVMVAIMREYAMMEGKGTPTTDAVRDFLNHAKG